MAFEVLNIDRQRAKMPVTMQSTRIITHFPAPGKPLFLLTGFRHVELLLKLGVNFAVLKRIEAAGELSKAAYEQLHDAFTGYDAFFILHNNPHAIDEVRLQRAGFNRMLKQVYLIDLEVLKAHELLVTGLDLEDTVIGLQMPLNATLLHYVREVRKEQRNGGTELYSYVSRHLIKEAERIATLPREALKSA